MTKTDAKCPRCGKRHVVFLDVKYTGRGVMRKYCSDCEARMQTDLSEFDYPVLDDVEIANLLHIPVIEELGFGYRV